MTAPFRGATDVLSRGGRVVSRRVRRLRVAVLAGPDQGAAVETAQDVVVVGTDAECDLVLADGAVSRRHLEIGLGAHGFSLRDLGSTNGTLLGGVRIGACEIEARVEVTLGQTVLAIEPLGDAVESAVSDRPRFGRMIGASVAMRSVFAALEKAAASELSILLQGETGTGKDLAAEAVHAASPRADGPFVAIDCGAIARELVESELFGHVKGAFTGAVRDRRGAFESAAGGTLFLDEIGELPTDLQPKLLRALERREVRAVGSDRTVAADVRIVAATSRDLEREVKAGRFRSDLYFRLAVVTVRIPPLRARRDDVALLAATILEELDRRVRAEGRPPLPAMAPEVVAILAAHDWPGNVRELRNVVERWAVLGEGLPDSAPQAADASAEEPLLALPLHEAKDALVTAFERRYLEALLARSGGNVSAAAREAGVDRRQMQRLLDRHGLRGGGTPGAAGAPQG